MARRRSVGYHLFAAGDHGWHLDSFVARFHAERVNQLEIETAPELLLRGLVNLQVGQLDHAEADFARAAALMPSDDQVAFKAGEAYAMDGRFDQARAWFARLAGRTPFDLMDNNPLGWGDSARLRLLGGDVVGYRQFCREMVRVHGASTSPEDFLQAAEACVLAPGTLDAPAEVIRLAERARDLVVQAKDESLQASALSTLGAVYDRAGEPSRAEELYRQRCPADLTKRRWRSARRDWRSRSITWGVAMSAGVPGRDEPLGAGESRRHARNPREGPGRCPRTVRGGTSCSRFAKPKGSCSTTPSRPNPSPPERPCQPGPFRKRRGSHGKAVPEGSLDAHRIVLAGS